MPAAVPSTPYHEEVVPFLAGDGRALNLIHVHGDEEATRGPVVLVHGAGVHANIFRAPVRQTVVDALIADGYDVWLENWRASIDVEPSEWTLDQAAVHDHPAAIRTVVRETGHDSVKAIIHCQGSTSFAMAAVAGLLPEVDVIVSNAVSLHPVVPHAAEVKLKLTVPAVSRLTSYLDPQWGLGAPPRTAKALDLLVRTFHHECDNRVCRWVSFTYGVGFPTLWRHENLNHETHDWLQHEFAKVPLSFFQRGVRSASRLVKGWLGLTHDSDVSEEIAQVLGDGTDSATSLPLLAMGRDIPNGHMRLTEDGMLDVDWRVKGSREYFRRVRQSMEDIADALEARMVHNPLSLLSRAITVHPPRTALAFRLHAPFAKGCRDAHTRDAASRLIHVPGRDCVDCGWNEGSFRPRPRASVEVQCSAGHSCPWWDASGGSDTAIRDIV